MKNCLVPGITKAGGNGLIDEVLGDTGDIILLPQLRDLEVKTLG